MDSHWTLLTILGLLVLSGFFSGSETALTAFSRARFHIMAENGSRRAQKILAMTQRMDRLISGILLGNNFVNILASALMTSLFLPRFGDVGVAWATLAMTVLLVVFAEILPKTFAIRNPNQGALILGGVLQPFMVILVPLARVLESIPRALFALTGRKQISENGEETRHEEELRGAIELHSDKRNPKTGQQRHERNMLQSILDLDRLSVADVMTHRSHVQMLDWRLPPSELIDKALSRSAWSRLPLYEGQQDNIVGLLSVLALARACRETQTPGKKEIQAALSPPWFIPETTALDTQLQAFRQRKTHFAFVVDEYGAYLGIVTLEDVLEVIVGDIDDEHDLSIEGVTHETSGTYLVNGEVSLRTLRRELGWKLPEDKAVTIAGLVLHHARQIPREGQRFLFHNFQFEILARAGNRIQKLRVTKPPDSPTQAGRKNPSA